jgi:hypothetical protein
VAVSLETLRNQLMARSVTTPGLPALLLFLTSSTGSSGRVSSDRMSGPSHTWLGIHHRCKGGLRCCWDSFCSAVHRTFTYERVS